MTKGTAVVDGLRERKKRLSVDRIIDAAAEILRQDGVEAMTVERIADRAIVSPSTVFNLVGRREHIWAAIVDRSMSALDLPDLVQATEGRTAARSVVAAIADMVGDDPSVFAPLMANWGQAAPLMRSNPARILADCFAAEGIERPHRRAEILVAGIIGMMHQWSLGLFDARELRQRAEDLTDLMFAPG